MVSSQQRPVKVFISYAHKDEELLVGLRTHLQSLQRLQLIEPWHDRLIEPGSEWATIIEESLRSSDLVLLLVSPDYIASRYCYDIEMPQALDMHNKGQAIVIPVILRPCSWEKLPFSKLQVLPEKAQPVTEWENQDKAWSSVVQGIEAIVEKRRAEPRTSSTAMEARFWHVPPSNPFFTAREDMFDRLESLLVPGEATAINQTQAVSGLGGIGKTQLAIEFAHRYKERYRDVLWLIADSRERLVSSYVQLAQDFNLPEKAELNEDKIVEAVQRWLSSNTDWLLILDNVEDLGLVRTFLPAQHREHVLLTTRREVTEPIASAVKLDTLSPADGALLLLRRARYLPPNASLDTVSDDERQQAEAISEVLGGLPLALDQAGAYILETGCGLSGYLKRYQKRHADLLRYESNVLADHPSVSVTFSLAAEKVQERNPAALDLLHLCAFLAPDNIPEYLITTEAEHLGDTLQLVAADDLALDEAIRLLRTYSLLTRNERDHTLSIHRLLQTVLRDIMDEETKQVWSKRSIAVLNQAFPKYEGHITTEQWERCEQLISHVLVSAELHMQWEISLQEAVSLFWNVAAYLTDRAQYEEAELLYQQALQIGKRVFGEGHPFVAGLLSNLASLYRKRGKYEKVELLLQRALQIWERELGAEHPFVAPSLNNLANLYRGQGKYEQAELLYQRALHIWEQALGTEHPDIASPLSGLANLYQEQGKYGEAEPLYQRALQISKRVLGAEHPDVAHQLDNLANLYSLKGTYVEAERLFQRALQVKERVLGAEHPDVAESLVGLANLYSLEGRYAEAEPLYQRVLQIWEHALGVGHLSTAFPLHGLAICCYEQRKDVEAERLLQRALQISKRVLGAGHPQVAYPLTGLATLYYEQAKYEEAETLYKQAFAIREQFLGLQHPLTRETIENYAQLLREVGRAGEAEVLEGRLGE